MDNNVKKYFHPGKRRGTPIPVAPPRVPTPMPVANNNNKRSVQKDVHVSSSGQDTAMNLISKTPYKTLDNDVKTAWINPRLVSKINFEAINNEYIPKNLNNMVHHQQSHRHRPQNHINSQTISHQKQHQHLIRGRSHGRGWESPANSERTKPHHLRPAAATSHNHCSSAATVTVLTQNVQDAIISSTSSALLNKRRKQPGGGNNSISSDAKFKPAGMDPLNNARFNSTRSFRNNKITQKYNEKSKGVVYQSAACYVGTSGCGGSGGVDVAPSSNLIDNNSVYGIYSETKYTFAVSGLQYANLAQSSAAAAFFARAAQKLNLSSSPHRRKRYNSDDGDTAAITSSGFCGVLHRNPPPVPPALLRRLGVKEVTGVGKVKVMLRVSSNPSSGYSPGDSGHSNNSFFSLDKRKKQVTLIDPSPCNNNASAPEDRRVGVAAPKMFAFDAIFSQDDSQTEICSAALTDVIHAVINGTDGCLFCFGHAGLGKTHTMLGTPDNANTLGIIPCAISWLFKGINEAKLKTGARFSVRVSAVEICEPTNQMKDLLSGYANDSEQSPGVYLRDDPLFGTQPPHCELRVPTAEKAAHYLDAALEGRTPFYKEESRDTHLLYTLHVYQYSVAGKGGVAGGRSRLHLLDLGNSDRSKSNGGIPLSGVGNILLGIFNGQKHLPYKEHKLTHLLKDCLSSLTCHAAMIVHVSPYAQNYSDTLTTVQLASRIHRMRRRRFKFVSTATGNGSGGSSGEEAARTTGTSSEPDPSSSDLSADTVIYVGPADDATDGEHPPVYIPSLNSGDNRCSMSKALRGSIAEQKPSKSHPSTPNHRPSKAITCQTKTSSRTNSPKNSPSHVKTTPVKKLESRRCQQQQPPPPPPSSDEQWIDGPRISKSKIAEARHFTKEPSVHTKKKETWIDGPLQQTSSQYGYMDNHKKNMIRKWVEHQTTQIQKVKKPPEKLKELTQFKTEDETMRPLRVEESTIRTGLKLQTPPNGSIPEMKEEKDIPEEDDEEDNVEIPPALPLIQPLSSREVSLESLDVLLKERMLNYQNYEEQPQDDDEILEIIEVEEPLEPVPMQDSCLQVTEEDIALCMGYSENPLPEVDQENPLDHPLRILSQENLTVVSTFTDSMSVYTDLERILPKHRFDYKNHRHDYDEEMDENTRKKFEQLAKIHELFTNRLAKANVANSETYKKQQKTLSRCESLSLNEMLYGETHDNYSVFSEPAYVREKFCENCKVNMSLYADPFLSASTTKLHIENRRDISTLANLRHPDGASNPNLRQEIVQQPFLPPPNSLPSTERMNRGVLNIETGVIPVKLTQKCEGYDSGHDSTPRTSKHSPAAISRRAESGYDSVVRDSESSSIDSGTTSSRISSSNNRKGKCKHKQQTEKSFCSWFLNPFTCKYIDEPPETHF